MGKWWCIYFLLCLQDSLPLYMDEALLEECPAKNLVQCTLLLIIGMINQKIHLTIEIYFYISEKKRTG